MESRPGKEGHLFLKMEGRTNAPSFIIFTPQLDMSNINDLYQSLSHVEFREVMI